MTIRAHLFPLRSEPGSQNWYVFFDGWPIRGVTLAPATLEAAFGVNAAKLLLQNPVSSIPLPACLTLSRDGSFTLMGDLEEGRYVLLRPIEFHQWAREAGITFEDVGDGTILVEDAKDNLAVALRWF